MTRAQKLIMIRQVILSLKLLHHDPRVEFFSDNCQPLVNTKLQNLPEEHYVLAIDGLSMICAYLYFGIGTPNSHLSMTPNAKQNLQNAFEILRHVDQSQSICDSRIDARFMSNSHIIRQMKRLMSTSSFLGMKNTQGAEEIFEEIRSNHGGQISIDIARF